MKWSSAISQLSDPFDGARAAIASLRQQLGDLQPHLVTLFISANREDALPALAEMLTAEFPGALLIGCTAYGVIGGAREVEGSDALSITAAHLPGVTLAPFHLDTVEFPPPTVRAAWEKAVGVAHLARPHFLLFADPFTSDNEALLAGLDRSFPEGQKVGGVASGGRSAGTTRLLLGSQVWRSGVVGVALSGNLTIETIVAQGCRPIGKPMLVTRCDDHVIHELDQRKPLEVLRELHATLSGRDQELFATSLFLGIEMRESEVEYQRGEFLVRNLVGLDPKTGAIAVGTSLKQFQAVQFLLRDAHTAEEDLARMLARRQQRSEGARPSGALMFSCVGRGEQLFGKPNHDSGQFREAVGDVPLGGFFCNGEIGPVGGITFIHGYTSAFALFSESTPGQRFS